MADEQFFDAQGCRPYLTIEERATFLAATRSSRRDARTLCETLHHYR